MIAEREKMDNITIENLHLENKGNLFAIIKSQRKEISELQDKLHRRNMQIKNLQDRYSSLIKVISVKGKLSAEELSEGIKTGTF